MAESAAAAPPAKEYGMEVPLELAFHGLDHSDWAETEIRKRVDRLARLHDRLTAVRVRVEPEGRQRRPANTFAIHVEMSVPGSADLVVNQEHAKQRYREPTLRTVIRDTFDTAERRLLAAKQQIGGAGNPHEAEMRGQISQIFHDQGRGLLINNAGSQLYFTRDALMHSDFDSLKRGDPVYYVEIVGDTGPIAKKVWPVEQSSTS
jgi:hypothetical protein